jgi:hypothetical protein
VKSDGEPQQCGNWDEPNRQEKPLARLRVTVPQTDAGRRVEYTKAIGRTLLKELCKMTP